MLKLEKTILGVMEHGASQKAIKKIINVSLKNSTTRKALINAVEKATYKMSFKCSDRPFKAQEDRYYMGRALLNSLNKIFDTGSMSNGCLKALSDIFLGKIFVDGIYRREEFNELNGFRPSALVTIAPSNVCNLRCKGCYAGDIYKHTTLKYEILDRVISDIKKEFGAYFFVITGGEPFAYREGGKTILDILEKHNDAYFMSYTNSTLISRDIAKRLSELGNLTPAISVEGFEAETDERRGKGTYKKIMAAMDNLKEYGVPFGISVTPTKYNADLLLSDEFIDFYFNRKGIFYAWYFQYMPIGRSPSMDLMVTPEQRYKMLKRIWELVKEEKTFIADFWNSGVASDGCIASARGGGYFYIMWDGTITPCVFIPFKDSQYGNLYKLYENGKSITDAIKSPLFTGIREWQNKYWIDQPKEKCGNLLAPCIIRDNSEAFYKIVKETGAKSVDEGAETYLKFIEEGKMPEYNKKYREFVDSLWEKEYLGFAEQ